MPIVEPPEETDFRLPWLLRPCIHTKSRRLPRVQPWGRGLHNVPYATLGGGRQCWPELSNSGCGVGEFPAIRTRARGGCSRDSHGQTSNRKTQTISIPIVIMPETLRL